MSLSIKNDEIQTYGLILSEGNALQMLSDLYIIANENDSANIECQFKCHIRIIRGTR